MISFSQALRLIRSLPLPSRDETVGLEDALGRRLAVSLRSPEDLPAFDNSAMDGWAVRLADVAKASEKFSKGLDIQGEIAAGDSADWILEHGKTLRIFTGARIPSGAQAVIAQEEVQESGASAIFFRSAQDGENIRRAGEDVREGSVLLKKYQKLGPGALGLMAAVGLTQARVLARPRVAHLASGSELVAFDCKPRFGQIRDSVSPLLKASLAQSGLALHSLGIVRDDTKALEAAVAELLHFDVGLITGGISVGKYDCVRSILEKAGVETLFWRVDIKPGKPIYLGKKGDTVIFGLPGNPLSALVGFEFFVRPLLARWMREPSLAPAPKKNSLKKGFSLRGKRKMHLVTVSMKGTEATPLLPQGSHRIGQLGRTQGVALLSKSRQPYVQGASVRVHRLEVSHV